MRTYKAVFSNIDGTLLTSEHIVSTATIEAIASLQKKKYSFYYYFFECFLHLSHFKKTSFPMSDRGMWGAWIEDMNGRILSNEGMSRQTAATVINL